MKIIEENIKIEDYNGHKLYRFDFCGSEAIIVEIVPFEKNTAKLERLYQELGGHIKVIAHPGKHHPHGLEDPTPVMEFIQQQEAH